MPCFHTLLTTYSLKESIEDAHWVLYIEICQRIASKNIQHEFVTVGLNILLCLFYDTESSIPMQRVSTFTLC